MQARKGRPREIPASPIDSEIDPKKPNRMQPIERTTKILRYSYRNQINVPGAKFPTWLPKGQSLRKNISLRSGKIGSIPAIKRSLPAAKSRSGARLPAIIRRHQYKISAAVYDPTHPHKVIFLSKSAVRYN